MEFIPSFIDRKHGKEKVAYLHPLLEPIMGPTYGIGVYQEQMMRIARDLAGFTLAEADTLRKAIGKKIKSLLDEQEAKLVAGMIKNGIDKKTAAAIWDLFPAFARYGFNKSHAVSYAKIGYQTAYLKTHYPVEFMTALLNADAGDVERAAFLVSECAKMGIAVLPPDINKSGVQFAPEGGAIRFGLLAIKNVGQNIVDAITAERAAGGPFSSVSDMLYRVDHKDLNKKSLESLAKCGALESLGTPRKTLVGNIDEMVKFASLVRKSKGESQAGLFGGHAVSANALQFKPAPPLPQLEELAWEKELLGFYVSDHPLSAYKQKLAAIKARPIAELLGVKSEKEELITGGLVAKVQRIVTKTGKPMAFAVIEDFTRAIEAIVFPVTLEKTAAVWEAGTVVAMLGHMSWRDNEPRFIVENARVL
jgi:DNA polymerase-3 subunit alpha